MTKSKKQKKNEIIKKYSKEEAREMTLNICRVSGDLNSTLQILGDNLLPEYMNSPKGKRDEIRKKIEEKALEVMMALETETHVALMETFTEKYRALSKELTTQIIKEYGCQTSLEKILAETIVNAYVRIIDNSRRLNNEFECREITKNKNVYIANLSKQLDRANQQFQSSLITLKQLKNPSIEMNIKTKNAFVSQNQQFNTNHENNESK